MCVVYDQHRGQTSMSFPTHFAEITVYSFNHIFRNIFFQLGVWRVPLQDVSVCALAELYGFDIYPGRHLHGAILCHCPSHNLQTDSDCGTFEGKLQGTSTRIRLCVIRFYWLRNKWMTKMSIVMKCIKFQKGKAQLPELNESLESTWMIIAWVTSVRTFSNGWQNIK